MEIESNSEKIVNTDEIGLKRQVNEWRIYCLKGNRLYFIPCYLTASLKRLNLNSYLNINKLI